MFYLSAQAGPTDREVIMSALRFQIGEVPTLGGWQVLDTVTGRVTRFGTDRIGALDFADHQNHAAERAAEFAADGRSCCPACGRPDVIVSLGSTLLETRPEVRPHACRVGSYGEISADN
jgi:hypothetical protein